MSATNLSLILTESPSARTEKMAAYTNESATAALNKAKALMMAMWQGTGTATTEQMADYYEVPVDTVQTFIKTNRDELVSDGLKKLNAKELKALRSEALGGMSKLDIPEKTTVLTIWTPRAALRLGMLLRDSEVAKQVRTVLLDTAMQAPAENQEVSLASLALSENFEDALVVILATVREKKKLAAENQKLLEANDSLQVEVQTLEPKADRYDLILATDGWMTGEEVVKQLNIPKFSVRKLYDILRKEKVLFKRPNDGTNIPYAEWSNEGLATIRDGQCFDGRMRFSPAFSWKGLDRILDILRKHQIIPKDKQYRFNFDSNKIVPMKRA